jgi:hypothetical protein
MTMDKQETASEAGEVSTSIFTQLFYILQCFETHLSG